MEEEERKEFGLRPSRSTLDIGEEEKGRVTWPPDSEEGREKRNWKVSPLFRMNRASGLKEGRK